VGNACRITEVTAGGGRWSFADWWDQRRAAGLDEGEYRWYICLPVGLLMLVLNPSDVTLPLSFLYPIISPSTDPLYSSLLTPLFALVQAPAVLAAARIGGRSLCPTRFVSYLNGSSGMRMHKVRVFSSIYADITVDMLASFHFRPPQAFCTLAQHPRAPPPRTPTKLASPTSLIEYHSATGPVYLLSLPLHRGRPFQ
jgi:hypothetical protein